MAERAYARSLLGIAMGCLVLLGVAACSQAPGTAASATERIVFMSNRDGNWNIYVMNADGGQPTRLTDDPADDFSPAWSPDRSRIAFASRRDGNWEIYVMNADGANQTRLTNHPGGGSPSRGAPTGTGSRSCRTGTGTSTSS